MLLVVGGAVAVIYNKLTLDSWKPVAELRPYNWPAILTMIGMVPWVLVAALDDWRDYRAMESYRR